MTALKDSLLLTIYPYGYTNGLGVKVSFYRTLSGNEPVRSFIKSLPKRDQGQFAEVLKSIIE